MSIRISCPNPDCEQSYNVQDNHLGRRVTCAKCGCEFKLSGASATARQSAGAKDTAARTGDTRPAGTRKKLGRFEIRDRLGAGAFGTVYQAYDPTLDREVALKVPHPEKLQTKKDKERFFREAKASAQLRHPNIVPVYDAGVDGDTYYMASAFIEGQTLEEAIKKERPDFARSVQVVRDLAGALQYAHHLNIIHRDIKPANIMIDGNGDPLLMDFGLARFSDSEEKFTVAGALMGTPAYMSTEQASRRNDEVGPLSDQYSLGVVLYELLVGDPPFTGPPELVISLVINQEPPAPRGTDQEIPKDLETICLKAMSKRSEHRFIDCAELSDDLRRWQEGEPIHARRISPAERLTRWCKRNPLPAGLATAVALTLFAGIFATSSFAVIANTQKNRANQNAGIAERRAGEAEAARNNAETERRRAEETALVAERERKRAEQQLFRTRRSRYAAQIAVAQRDIKDHDYAHAMRVLNSTASELRGWEYEHVVSTLKRRVAGLMGHDGSVRCAVFSPDGSLIASGSEDHTVRIWDSATGKQSAVLRSHDDTVFGVAFSPDGRLVASGSGDHTIKVWDVSGREETVTLRGHSEDVLAVAFSPDGQQLVSGSGDKTIKVWDIANGEEVFTLSGHTDVVGSVAFSPNGEHVASGSHDHTVRVWDVSTRESIHTFNGNTGFVYSVAFSPDGERIVSGTEYYLVMVWDARTGQQVLALDGHVGRVHSVAFSRDGRRIVSGAGTYNRTHPSEIKIWDAITGQLIATLKGRTEPLWIWTVAFSPDGRRIVSGSQDGLVKVWEPGVPEETLSLDVNRGPVYTLKTLVYSVDFSPDSRRIVSGNEYYLAKIWDASDGREIHTLRGHPGRVYSVAFGPFGRQVVSSGGVFDRSQPGSIRVWDAGSGKETFKIQWHSEPTWIQTAVVSPDGRHIVAGGEDNLLTIWNAKTQNKVRTLSGHAGTVWRVAFSPDGSRLVSGSEDRTVKVWDAATGENVTTFTGHTGGVFGVAFSPDGQRVGSASHDKTVRLWDVTTGDELFTARGHTGSVFGVAFSPEGQRMVSCSSDSTVKLWDVSTGEEMLTLCGHMNGVQSVAFSPDGRRIAAGGGDSVVKVWDAGMSKHN